MQEDQKKKVLRAFQVVLRPIVRILLRFGIGYNEFAETIKTSFVEVGSSDFGIRGRPTNISRVAVMTGLTRKEVRRLRSKIVNGETSVNVKTTPITEILTRWHSEDNYLDVNGRPKTLPFSGETGSFASLVKSFGGDVPPGAMRTEMKRMGLVEEHDDSSLSVRSRLAMDPDGTERLVTGLVHGAYPLLSTIAANTASEFGKGEGFAQFSTYSMGIGASDRGRLRRISYDRLSEAAISFDDLFTAYETVSEPQTKDEKMPVVMVGLYYFEETDDNAVHEW